VRFLDAIAFGKRLGKQNIENFFKVSQAHPIEQQRRTAQYMTGQRSLLEQLGYGPEEELRAMAENEEYYRRLRELYNQIYGATVAPSSTAGEKATKVLSVPQ